MRTSRWLAALTVLCSLAACTAEPPAGTPAPGPSDAPASTTGQPGASRVRLPDLSRGVPPRVAWVDHGEHVAADGTRTPIPDRYGVSAAVPLGDGFLVADTRVFEGSVGLGRYDADGRLVEGWASAGSPVRSDDGRRTAWTTFVAPESGETGWTLVHVAGPDGSERQHRVLPDGGQVSAHGFLDDAVVFSRFWGRGVFLAGAGTTARVPGLRFAHAVDDRHDRVAGSTGTDGGIAVMVDAGPGDVLWRAPGSRPVAFSPDGTRVLAISPRGTRALVLDARSGEVRQEVASPFPLWEAVWEDGSHLLAVVVQDGRAAVVRVGLEGHLELAAPVVPADPSSPPYTLATG